jgi:hypothetical protein
MCLPTVLISLFILGSATTTNTTCNSSYYFKDSPYADCTFEFDYLDDTCNWFDFRRCTWKQCSQERVINNSKVCTKNKTYESE